MSQTSHLRLVSIFVVVLFCFLVVSALLVARQQRNLLYTDIYRHAVQNLDLMADASFEALLKSDYVSIRTFVARWGAHDPEIREIRVVAPNGYVIAEYRDPSPEDGENYSINKEVTIANRTVAALYLVGGYGNAEMISSQLRNRLILSALLITVLLGVALWQTFRRLGLAPLEKMVEERTRSLLATNQELEQEIAERIRAQAALVEREERITLILNSISEGIYGLDLEGKCTFCNPAALRLLGYERAEEVIGRPMHQLIHHTRPDGTPYHRKDCKIYSSYLEGHGFHVDDEVFWRSDGTSFPVEYWVQPIIRDNSPIGAVTAFTDIAERRDAEAALRDQEEELSSIFRHAPYLMVLLDRDRRVVRGNSAAFEHSGKPASEVVGSLVGEALRCINSLNAPDGCGSGPNCATCTVRNTVLDTMGTGRSHYQREARLRMDDRGHDKTLTVLISTARLSVRNQPMVLVSMHDVTENKRLEAQLLQSQKMESIGQLAGGIAHDFNNVLSVILGYGEMVLGDMAEDDPQRQRVGHMMEAGDKAAHLTRDLLLFSRKQALEKTPVDLNGIIRGLEKFLTRVIGEDIAFDIRLGEGELPVLADANQLQQVLMNLATNARDAMPQGGSFTISTELVPLDEEFTSTHGLGTPGRYALITISDNGRGMDEDTRLRVFEPFFTTKETGKGTGLGLAVAYGIVRQHDGCINLYSEKGIGTTFRIYLPVIEAGLPAAKSLPAGERPVGGTETILLAEDDERVRDLTGKILKDFGYTVIAAVDGGDALNKYQEHMSRIQLLLFDLIMPKKGGKEAYDEIRSIRQDVKVIFLTGYAPDIFRGKASLENGVPVVYKPFSSADLLEKVRSVLDEGKA